MQRKLFPENTCHPNVLTEHGNDEAFEGSRERDSFQRSSPF
jgi:hypothetical protein